MRREAGEMGSRVLRGRVRGLPFVAAGLGLFALKFFADSLIARICHRPFSLLFYVSPMDSPLVHPGQAPGYWLLLWAVALPFIAIGLVLTIGRLRDAGAPLALSLFFFLPFGNLLFFVIAALLPSAAGTSTRGEPREAPQRTAAPRYGLLAAAVVAGVTGCLVGLSGAALSFMGVPVYGAALLLGAPVVSGFVSSVLFCRLHAPLGRGIMLSTTLALLFAAVVIMAFALEGIICLLMASPLVILGAFLGSLLGFQCSRRSGGRAGMAAGAALALLPFSLGLERLNPLPVPDPEPVSSSRVVDAPPDVVWRNVIQFPDLDPPRDAIFRMGIAAPLGASITGEGVGALRRCHFTTGDFLEPIQVWKPGRELTFSVARCPDPLRELTLWDGPRPPHLDGYLESVRGQFLLEPLPGGRTRLTGRTWYRTHMVPEIYWRLWADPIIHRIHSRVLNHVARLSEREHRLAYEGRDP